MSGPWHGHPSGVQFSVGRNPRRHRRWRNERRVFHAQRLEDPLTRELIERLAAHAADDVAEQEEIDVAVDEPFTGCRSGHFFDSQGNGGLGALPRVGQIDVRTQPGHVSQQVPDGDVCLPVTFEPRDVARDPVAQADSSLLDQHHHARRRRHNFRQRREIENRIERHGLDRRNERAIPEGLLVDDAVAPADEHDRSRQFLVLNRLAHEGLDEVEASRFDRRLVGGHGASRGHWRARRTQPGGRLPGQANQQDQRQQLVHGPGLYLCVSTGLAATGSQQGPAKAGLSGVFWSG